MTATPPYATTRAPRPIGRNAFIRLYRGQTQYDFINRWKIWFAISGAVIAIGLVALGVRGLNFTIDFRGGTVWEVPTTASVSTVRSDLGAISGSLRQATYLQLTNRQTGKVNIEVQASAATTTNQALVQSVTKELAKIGHVSADQVTLSAVGPSWGSDITNKAVEAVIVFLVLISVCIAVYFETKMAVAALAALLHDMLVTVGIYALSGFQVSPDTVIAFLTVLGYSLYDTIVVFDKVKENTRGLASTNRVTYTDVVNLSMNQVMARSINTSFVAIMPVLCILVIGAWILGATALNDFGLALFIGLTSGAYSSIFIASPILALLKEREPRYTEIRKRLAAYPQARQVLTPASVAAGGFLMNASSGGASAGGSRGASRLLGEGLPAGTSGARAGLPGAAARGAAGMPRPSGVSRAGGAARAASASSTGSAISSSAISSNAGGDVAGDGGSPGRSAGPADVGHEPSAEAVSPKGAAEGPESYSGPASGPVRAKSPAPGQRGGPAGRRTPPRPHRKVPRHR